MCEILVPKGHEKKRSRIAQNALGSLRDISAANSNE